MGKSFSAKRIIRAKSTTLALVSIVFIVMFWALNRSYLGMDNIRGIMYSMSYSGIIACGIGCLLISGSVDLAAGAEGCFAGVLIAVVMSAGVPWPVAIIIALAFGVCAGLVNAFFANVLNIMPFIATIGMASVWSGLAYVVSKGQSIAISQQGYYQLSAFYVLGTIPLPFVIMVVLFLLYGFLLTNTPFGRIIYMCGGNRSAARLAGINPKKVTTALFINCGIVSSLAGMLVASTTHFGSPTSVTGMEMNAIAATVLGGISFMGGTGGMVGAFIGLLLINCFNTGLISAGLQAYWQVAAQGVMLLVALMADYFNSKSRNKSISGEGIFNAPASK